MAGRSIRVSIQPAYRKYGYLYIPAQNTDFFPPGVPKTRIPITIETDTGPVQAVLQYNSRALV